MIIAAPFNKKEICIVLISFVTGCIHDALFLIKGLVDYANASVELFGSVSVTNGNRGKLFCTRA